MRVRIFSRLLKTISLVVLFFFVWTFGEAWQLVAYAAAPERQGTRVQGPGSRGQGSVGSAERFEKALDGIRENVAKAREKEDRGEDDTREREAIKAKRAEIESADGEFKKEFSVTEKKLRDAKLPKEILDRHAKFVKHYEDNMKELRANLDDIDTLKADSRQRKAAFTKAKAHLEKVKAPSRHQKLDPDNLPFKARKAGKTREPRLKKEEFEKAFPSKKKIRTALNLPDLLAADSRRLTQILDSGFKSAVYRKPILVASNGSLAGLLSSDNQLPRIAGNKLPLPSVGEGWGGAMSQLTVSDSSPFLLAQQTADLPSPDDLSEAPPAIQFTTAIRAKAQNELSCNPTKIFNWVRNNINYEPYYGSFKSADQTLLEGAGNDFDQASLLISLMRVCNIAAKYSYGTVEIPADQAANMVGVSDPKMAATILATQGIPVKTVMSGGTVKAIQMERAWVETFIDYFPSWGARHKQGGEDTWIPLDPSFKQYTYKQGMDIYALMGFNAEDFLMSYITDTRDITAYQDYSMRMINFLDANYPDASVEDVLGASEIKATATVVKQEFPYLLGTLPYKVIVQAAQFSQIPSTQDYAITIQIEGDSLDETSGLSYTGELNDLASKRVTVSYDPATSSDEALIAQYGGNMYSVPPYLLNLKPVLRISGTVVATGGSIGLGKDQTIVITFAGPDGDSDRIQNIITAGAYSAIILQSQNTPITTPSNNMAVLIENSKRVDSPDITLDDLLGQLLYSIGVSYFETLSYENEVFSKTLQLVTLRQPSEAMVTQGIKIDYLFGLPWVISSGSVKVDVDRNVNVVISPTQDKEREKAFMLLSGLASSVSENRILEAFFDVPSVSSVRLLKQASEQSIPIYTITSTNLNEILPLLQVDADVKTDIENAANAHKEVIVSKTKIKYDQWVGVGYIINDPITGAASYMISGGLGGGESTKTPIADPTYKVTWMDSLIFKIVRSNIIIYAEDLIGTLYKMGCKDPSVTGQCRNRIDCSGLTARCYVKAGLDRLLGNGSDEFPYKNAKQQYDYSQQTDDPLYADLVFFKGSYDKNCDGLKDADDGVTHVAIYRSPDIMIGAQGKGVKWYEISSWGKTYPKYCKEFVCLQQENGVCVKWDTCNCALDSKNNKQWFDVPNSTEFDPFVGYGKIIP